MTAAFHRALELHPEPASLPKNYTAEQAAARARAILIRYSITSDEWPRMVRAFRTLMQREIYPFPQMLPPAEKMLHANMISSELQEFIEAGDVIEAADGLLDVIYVCLGALVHMGFSDSQILSGFAEIQASNLTKVQDDGRPLINDGVMSPAEPVGKILKTHNYIRPNLVEAMGVREPGEPSPDTQGA